VAARGQISVAKNSRAASIACGQLPPGASLGLFGEDGLATLLVTSGVLSSEPSEAGGVLRTVVVLWPGDDGASSEHALATPLPHTTTMIALRIRERDDNTVISLPVPRDVQPRRRPWAMDAAFATSMPGRGS